MSDVQRMLQEAQYGFPYHYIPRRLGRRIAYSAAVDWAAEYLNALELTHDAVRRWRPKSVADIGCGDGRIANELAREHSDLRVWGVDQDRRAVQLAELQRSVSNVSFHVATRPEEWPFHAAGCDLVLAIEVLEHIPPPELLEFVSALARCTTPGGHLLVTVPHANKRVQRKHYQHFTGTSLRKVLADATGGSFGPADIRFVDPLPRGFEKLVGKIARNRLFTIEPLFQAVLRRRSRCTFVAESGAGRIVASAERLECV